MRRRSDAKEFPPAPLPLDARPVVAHSVARSFINRTLEQRKRVASALGAHGDALAPLRVHAAMTQ